MRQKIIDFILCIVLISLFIGCATTNYKKGRTALNNENFDSAIEFFTLAVQENPNNPKAVRDLGIAYYRNVELEKSAKILGFFYSP